MAISVSHLVGEDAGYSVLARDIRVRKAAEAELQRQARWQTATAEIRLSLLSEASLGTSLGLVCKWAVQLAGAGAAALLIDEGGGHFHAVATNGDEPSLDRLTELIGTVENLAESAAINLANGMAATIFPISFPRGDGGKTGALVVVGTEPVLEPAPPPGAHEVLASLASQAVLAVELANVRSERDRLLISADRERIARDLHDLVIQRLFGAGLRLQGALALIDNETASTRVSSTIDDLDATIKEIREAIFALERAPGESLRSRVLEAVTEATESLGCQPEISFHGVNERFIPLVVQLEAVTVLREALSNVARHAQASRVEVRVTVDDGLGILVVDNGIGVGEPARLSGIANARARAELLGGHLELTTPSHGGTRFDWQVPIAAPAAGDP